MIECTQSQRGTRTHMTRHLQLVGDLSCGTVAPEVPKDLVSQFEGGAHLRSERDLRPGAFASFCTSSPPYIFTYFHILFFYVANYCNDHRFLKILSASILARRFSRIPMF